MSGDQMDATAVYVRPAREYLIAWEDYHLDANSGDIYAQRLSKQTGLVGNVLTVSTEDSHQISPALPAQSDTGQLTMVWQDHRNANWDVFGHQMQVPVLSIWLPLVFK